MIEASPSLNALHLGQLADLNQQGRYRRLIAQEGIDLSSNDYLGLAGSPRLKAAISDAIERGVPVGSGGSRLLRGNHPEHELLEEEAALFFKAEAALFFSSGYAANAALFSSLPQKGDLVVYDSLVHASAHEGMRLGRADAIAADHNDVGSFDDAIRSWRHHGGTGRVWIAVESLYSMDGDLAPLDALATLAREHDAFLVIDEAHATGVFGPNGRGLGADLDGQDNVISLRTCGKALGCEGALLTGPRFVRDFLVNRGRAFIFSTAPSPLMASAVREALRILADEPERRARLGELAGYARARLGDLGKGTSASQIVPVIIGDDVKAMAIAGILQEAGYDVRGIRPPTVPAGTARLRVSITLNVTRDHIDGLAELIRSTVS
ncbi:MAG: 8-amino-7-oxononanoate synthase [Sphingorhabdus sp.]